MKRPKITENKRLLTHEEMKSALDNDCYPHPKYWDELYVTAKAQDAKTRAETIKEIESRLHLDEVDYFGGEMCRLLPVNFWEALKGEELI